MRIRKWLLGYFAITAIVDILLTFFSILIQCSWQNYIATPLYVFKELLSVGIYTHNSLIILLALLPMLAVGALSIAGLLKNDRWIQFVWPIVGAHMCVLLVLLATGVQLPFVLACVVVVALLICVRWIKRIWQIMATLSILVLGVLIECILCVGSNASANVLMISIAIDVAVWILGHNKGIK